MATALENAVENIISLQSNTCHDMDQPSGNVHKAFAEGAWCHQAEFLMKGPLSLDVAVGGSQTAGVALKSLVQNHGDIVSECWSSDFDT